MGAQTFLRVERSLAIRSTWNIPSDRYPLSSQAVRDLRDAGEIGGHDTLHDGRLSFLDMKAKAQRLRDCTERLETPLNPPPPPLPPPPLPPLPQPHPPPTPTP